MVRFTSYIKRPATKKNSYAPEPVEDVSFPFDVYVAAVYPNQADIPKLKRALENAIANDVPISAGVLVRQHDQIQVEVDHDDAGVPFTVQTTDDLTDRELAKILDEGDVDDDGCSSRVCRWLADDSQGRERAHALSELVDGGRLGIDAHVLEPVTRVRLTQARGCYVVCVQASHLPSDAWSVFLLWDAWSRAYASLSTGTGDIADTTSKPVWWDGAQFRESLPTSRPGGTAEFRSFEKALPVWMRERSEAVMKARAGNARRDDDEGHVLWLRVSDDGMRSLREASGSKTFDVLMHLLSPENVRWFRIAYDLRISHPDSDSSHFYGRGAIRLYGCVAEKMAGIEAGDVRRALRHDACDFPTRADVVHGPFLAVSYWSHEPSTFPAGNAMPAFGSSVGRTCFPASFLLSHWQDCFVPLAVDSDRVCAFIRRVSDQYMVACYGIERQLRHIALEVRRHSAEVGLREGASESFEVHVARSCASRPRPLDARAAEAG
ncbi:hypothetical protein NFJ02_01g41350 [Pycnococcus provasolii]